MSQQTHAAHTLHEVMHARPLQQEFCNIAALSLQHDILLSKWSYRTEKCTCSDASACGWSAACCVRAVLFSS